ncbi:hypothetical protein EEL30_14500 [Brevibacillus laterosporus]|uniref:Uncharacterized protein n=1 Tax=Brevibacillus laterosporus TaxID=1465 RepID=A0A518V8W1_BRELA|nr:hypothetical protein EEL30_14500 [Brevibacillus laterosporus]
MIVTHYLFQHKLDEGNYLLLNSLTGAVDVVEQHVITGLKQIRQHGTFPFSPKEHFFLLERGYLYEDRTDEKKVVDQLIAWSRKHRDEHTPITFVSVRPWPVICDVHTVLSRINCMKRVR